MTHKIIGVLLLAALVVGATLLFRNDTPPPFFGDGGGDNSFYSGAVSATSTTLTIPGFAQEVLTENSARKYAIIVNTGATIAYLSMNATTTVSGITSLGLSAYTIPLAASGGTYVIDSDNLYLGHLLATSTAAVTIRALQAY